MPSLEVALLAVMAVAVVVSQRRALRGSQRGSQRGAVRQERGERARPSAIRTGRETGAAQHWQDLYFQVPCARPDEVLRRIIEVIDPLDRPPPGADAIYLRRCAFDHVVFGFGNSLEEQFLAAVAVGTEDLWCLGHFIPLTWIERDGEMVAAAPLHDLYERIHHAVEAMGGVSTPAG